MKKLYAISGVSGMTGSELVHQILMKENNADVILGFDNFYLAIDILCLSPPESLCPFSPIIVSIPSGILFIKS